MKKERKPNIDMICSIDELKALFKQGQSIQGFLSQVVSIISQHMDTDACTIFLYNEKKEELVLRATVGLNSELIGKLTIGINEGLAGLALKELRPILEERGQDNPNFKVIPHSGEDRFSSYLAVPIVRGIQKVGVLVLQDEEARHFSRRNVLTLMTIASQLAATLENAQLIIEKSKISKSDDFDQSSMRILRGTPLVEGVALGEAYHVEGPRAENHLVKACDVGYSETLEGFRQAISRTEEQLKALQAQLEIELADVASLIFSAHLLILRDAGFFGAMEALIEEGVLPCQAVERIANEYIGVFGDSDNPRMKEKILDIKDLGHRILKNLLQNDTDRGDYTGQLILTNELLPSELLKLAAQKVEGIVVFGGSMTAHITVLASSLQVPMMFTEDDSLFSIPPNTNLALDAIQGLLFIQPDEAVRKRVYQLKVGTDRLNRIEAITDSQPCTSDGISIHLKATVNLLSDLKLARKLNVEGIGLYRSEFPFLIRNDFPSEEEQYQIYRQVVDAMKDSPATLRTLDVGGDKMLSYLPSKDEPNPFLGLRGIRFLLKNELVFVRQVRAMIRAGGQNRTIRILFPLISSLDDFRNARNIVKKCLDELEKDGSGTFSMPDCGAMIELPSAVMLAQELADEADFLSIGTNDLIQYTLGVDRTNEKVANLFDTCHPSVLRAIKTVAVAAQRSDCPVSICGIMASDPRSVYYMLGLGIKEFSLVPGRIPDLLTSIAEMSAKKACKDAEEISQLGTLTEIREYFVKNGI